MPETPGCRMTVEEFASKLYDYAHPDHLSRGDFCNLVVESVRNYLRAERAAALEEAARKCDAVAENMNGWACAQFKATAAAIRELKEQP